MAAAPEDLRGAAQPAMNPWTLRFDDPELERAFGTEWFRQNLVHVRWAYGLGIVLWAAIGILAWFALTADREVDAVIRYGIAIPSTAVALGLSFTSWYERRWQAVSSAAVLASSVAVVMDWALIYHAPSTWGFTGLMLILAFNYVFVRLRFVVASITGAVAVAFYNVVAATEGVTAIDLLYADFFLGSMVVMGMSVAYLVERTGRLLFLRERQLAIERERSDALLRNTLPDAVVERLKDGPQTIADAFASATVLFADLERFTEHAERLEPRDLVHVLDGVFRRFDALADRHGLEKIKTVGDAYMAVAGVPQPRADHAEAAAEMAIELLRSLEGACWPSGKPMRARVGIASGPLVAGVIGNRKFAYDLWGDTVNLASRLEAHGVPGKIQVSSETYQLLCDRYRFEPPHVVDLKGKGPTRAAFLLERAMRRAGGEREG